MSSMAVAIGADEVQADDPERLESRQSQHCDLLADPLWLETVERSGDTDQVDALDFARGIGLAVPLGLVLWLGIYFIIESLRR